MAIPIQTRPPVGVSRNCGAYPDPCAFASRRFSSPGVNFLRTQKISARGAIKKQFPGFSRGRRPARAVAGTRRALYRVFYNAVSNSFYLKLYGVSNLLSFHIRLRLYLRRVNISRDESLGSEPPLKFRSYDLR
ncbi:hypothetical protein EVAR_9368_1 [Eumeta japonica]|uniref:Uncharacterized protein n=1 Tax=Eumeta variegata TaxID=151549 RepID=A0A4C1YT49_EUMVA|nr:hypothetical protein EVAR_9368_1 [Eumeta japonica]